MSEAGCESDWEWAEGVAFCRRFGDCYHSRAGALAQAEAVFLAGVGLPQRWQGRRHFALLENGFGFGVNALVTLATWFTDPQRCAALDYVGIDAYPRSSTAMARFWSAMGDAPLQQLAETLLSCYPPPTPGFHRLWLADGRVRVTLVWLPAEMAAKEIVGQFDALYLDGFSPTKNPEMWSEPLLAALVRRLAPDGRVATWSVAGAVRRALAAAGLTVVRRPGFGGKRERLEAFRSVQGPPSPSRPDSVAVVGAGLAGGATAAALAERGVTVTLFEAQSAPALGASGNPAGAARWLPSRDDNCLAQWTRSGLLTLRRRWPRWEALGAVGSWCGALQVARNATDAARMQEAAVRWPALQPHLTYLNRELAASAVGVPVAEGGWWLPDGGWVQPATLVRAWLASAPIETRWAAPVTALTADEEGGWHLSWWDGARHMQQRFDAVVLTVGAGATPLWPTPLLPWGEEPHRPGLALPLVPVRGQVAWGKAIGPWAALRAVVTGHGYVVPAAATGSLLFGATAAAHDWEVALRDADQEENRRRLAAMVALAAATLPAAAAGRVSWRAATRDHLPIVGALPLTARWDDPKRWQSRLWVVNGLGARGIAVAALAGELLAARLCGEPLPLGRTLVDGVDPARFSRRCNLLYSTGS